MKNKILKTVFNLLFAFCVYGPSSVQAMLVFGVSGSTFEVMEMSRVRKFLLRAKSLTHSSRIKIGETDFFWPNVYFRDQELTSLGDVSMLSEGRLVRQVFLVGKNASGQIGVIFKNSPNLDNSPRLFSPEQFYAGILRPIHPHHPVLVRHEGFYQRDGWAAWQTVQGDYLVIHPNDSKPILKRREDVLLSETIPSRMDKKPKYHIIDDGNHYITEMQGLFPSINRVLLERPFFAMIYPPLLRPIEEPSPQVRFEELGLTSNVYFEMNPNEGHRLYITGKLVASFADHWVQLKTDNGFAWVKSEALWVEATLSSLDLTEYVFLEGEGYSAEFGRVGRAFRKIDAPATDAKIEFLVQGKPSFFCNRDQLSNSASTEKLAEWGWGSHLTYFDENHDKCRAYLVAGTWDKHLALLEKDGKRFIIPGGKVCPGF